MVLFPDLTHLDLTAPLEVLARVPGVEVHLIAGSLEPVRSDTGLRLIPDFQWADAPPLDLLFVPGGPGVGAAMQDDALLRFLRARANEVRYVTAVCTGALVVAAAGLLAGYRATTHWTALELLARFPGVAVVPDRVVVDRDRVTGGGVTAGLDFSLTLAGMLAGEDVAREISLLLEYAPAPPFAGSPHDARPDVVERLLTKRQALQQERRAIVERVVAAAVSRER